MAKQIPTIFTAYELTEREQLEATVLTELQTKHILTMRADAATSKNNIDLDPEHMSKYLQDEAYYRGQMDILSYLLESHDASMQALNFNEDTEEQ